MLKHNYENNEPRTEILLCNNEVHIGPFLLNPNNIFCSLEQVTIQIYYVYLQEYTKKNWNEVGILRPMHNGLVNAGRKIRGGKLMSQKDGTQGGMLNNDKHWIMMPRLYDMIQGGQNDLAKFPLDGR